MQKDTFDSFSEDAENGQTTKFSNLINPVLWIQLVTFILGLILLIYLLYSIGFATVYNTLIQIGWGFFLIVLLNGVRHFLRAFCIYLAVPPDHRTFKFRYALSARLAGEAVSVVTFTGPFLGDATKAALLKKNIPLSQSGAAVIVDNMLYYASVISLILGGVAVMAYSYSYSNAMKYALFIISISAVIGIFILGFIVWFRLKPLSWLLKKYSHKKIIPKFIVKKKESIRQLEDNVYQMYIYRRPTFLAVLGINFVAHLLSVVEVYAALLLLGYASSMKVAFIIEALTKVINFAFSFIPGMVGVYEGGNGVILKALGYTTAIGVALALVRRGSILFWAFVGLVILLWETVSTGTRKIIKRSEVL